MNKAGQVGIIGIIFLLLVFLILWAVWLGGWIAETGQNIIAINNLTGVEAFFYANLNLVILFALILGTMAYFYFGGR